MWTGVDLNCQKINDLTLNMAVKDLWLHLRSDDSNDLSVSNIDQSLMLQSGVNGWEADLTWIALTKDFTWLDTEQPVSWPAQERNDWSRNRKQLLDELLWYDVQTCTFPSGGIVITSSLNLPPSSGEHFRYFRYLSFAGICLFVHHWYSHQPQSHLINRY